MFIIKNTASSLQCSNDIVWIVIWLRTRKTSKKGQNLVLRSYSILDVFDIKVTKGEMSVKREEQSHLVASKWFVRIFAWSFFVPRKLLALKLFLYSIDFKYFLTVGSWKRRCYRIESHWVLRFWFLKMCNYFLKIHLIHWKSLLKVKYDSKYWQFETSPNQRKFKLSNFRSNRYFESLSLPCSIRLV